ncbi:TerL protein [Pseudomaricurvus alkylphenolicus]|uniref:TerL protein n=1 Tax=Pseudomaricurvus alkylphenolicus TaxID=1306991 RepID=UPI00141D7C5D|nr:TerL protein [Pseudomaricurvus alkylphenolicus]NIB43805.1 TerL protein [Pseudomaricurvus alkylphenolicus]
MDYVSPNYSEIFAGRADLLQKLREDSDLLKAVKVHYANNPADFICDWGMTYDPRKMIDGGLANIPFILWGRQRDYIEWLDGRFNKGERGLVEKSRDCGVTWLSVGYAVTKWLFVDGFAAGFGSRKEQLVDKLGDPDSIFEKIRHFVGNLPDIFLPVGFSKKEHATYMRLLNPANGSSITGEAGDNIGRGGRKSVYFVDEAAFIEHQEMVDAALSQTTNCQIDISTFNGNGNPFYVKQQRFAGTERHFVFDWRDDPRKDEEWYQKQKEEQSEETVAQEIDRDPNASNTDAFIPAKWVAAAIDAHIKLGFEPSGVRTTGFDPADTGDNKGVTNRHGSVITDAEELTKGDITTAIPWAFSHADQCKSDLLIFDGDGMGTPAMKMALHGMAAERFKILPYYGGGEVRDKDKRITPGDRESRTNGDTYLNFRSQSATWLRDRFKATYDAIQRYEKGQLVNANPDDLISISSKCKHLTQLQAELSRPKRIWTKNGKIQVESKKEMKSRGVSSPGLFDSTVIAFSENTAAKKKRKIRYKIHRPRDRAMGY